MAARRGVSSEARIRQARERERIAFDMQMSGATIAQIAERLGVARVTVSVCLERELRRRGLRRVWVLVPVDPERLSAAS